MIRPQRSLLSRRNFLLQTALAAAALPVSSSLAAEPKSAKAKYPIIAFSKPFQTLDPQKMADFVAEVGWDGIECPVRPKGQIEPERAADELPRLAEVMRERKLDVHMLTTNIIDARQPQAEIVLRTASKLGIKRIRLGYWKYASNRSPADQLKEIAPRLKDIADACKELGLQAGYQNHSGRDYVGAPIWDIFSMIQHLDPKHIGMCFDIGHATVEGGLSWPIDAKLIEPFYTTVYIKDFYWKKDAKGWRTTWCSLGDGMVNKAFFDTLKKSAYNGPISQHHEYELGDQKQMLAHMQKDLQVLKQWLA